MQVYVDDIVIMTRVEETLLADIRQMFDSLNRYSIKLNPSNVSSASPRGSYWDISSQHEELKQTLIKSRQSDRKSTRLNSSHSGESRMPSSA